MTRFLAALAIVAAALAPRAAAARVIVEEGTPSNVSHATSPVPTKVTALTRIQRMVARINKEAETPEGEAAVVAKLARQYHTSPDSLQAQHSEWGLNYGEMAMVYGFARSSRKPGMTPDQVVELRRSGMEWQAIAHELGVSVDAVASRMARRPVAAAGGKSGKR